MSEEKRRPKEKKELKGDTKMDVKKMNEEKMDRKELTDKELEKVTGGGMAAALEKHGLGNLGGAVATPGGGASHLVN